MSSVTTSLDFDAIAAGGDSLLEGSGLHVQLESSDGQSLHAARIVPNRSGRLAQIRLTVTADDFCAPRSSVPSSPPRRGYRLRRAKPRIRRVPDPSFGAVS
ncbi:MAG: hypothetical protein WAK28_19715 [Trebonia sp.]